jgi:hypothetical protein
VSLLDDDEANSDGHCLTPPCGVFAMEATWVGVNAVKGGTSTLEIIKRKSG